MPVDPVEFGQLKAEVEGLRRDVDRLVTGIEEIKAQLSEARGGWKALMFIGGASASLGGVATWLLTHIAGKGPT